jgi:hypothetical protein
MKEEQQDMLNASDGEAKKREKFYGVCKLISIIRPYIR